MTTLPVIPWKQDPLLWKVTTLTFNNQTTLLITVSGFIKTKHTPRTVITAQVPLVSQGPGAD